MIQNSQRLNISDIRPHFNRAYRLFAGLAGVSVIAILPGLSALLYVGVYDLLLRPDDGLAYYSHWRNGVGDILVWLSIALFVAIAAVYFLRLLFWLRHIMQTSWKEHTPPFKPAESEMNPVENSVDDLLPEAKNSAVSWLKRGLFFYAGTLLFLLGVGLTLEYFGLSGTLNSATDGAIIPQKWMDYTVKTVKMLPFIGDLSVFFGMLPGRTPIQKLLINGSALFFTVAIRNLSYVFGNVGYLYKQAEWWSPNGSAIYLVMTALGQLLLICLSLLLAISSLA
jgi:hypothetical protein